MSGGAFEIFGTARHLKPAASAIGGRDTRTCNMYTREQRTRSGNRLRSKIVLPARTRPQAINKRRDRFCRGNTYFTCFASNSFMDSFFGHFPRLWPWTAAVCRCQTTNSAAAKRYERVVLRVVLVASSSPAAAAPGEACGCCRDGGRSTVMVGVSCGRRSSLRCCQNHRR